MSAIAIGPTKSDAVGAQPRDIDGTSEVTRSRTPELVIALCGPIGSPLHQAADQFANSLTEFGYTAEKIRLSNLIRLNADLVEIPVAESSKYQQIRSLIAAGDELRNRFGKDVLAKLAVAKISADRDKRYGHFEDIASEASSKPQNRISRHRICHIIDSIKNASELELLRSIYGDALFAIGIFSTLEIRIRNLGALNLSLEEIHQLIDTDSGEEFAHGQTVRDTFPQCDFFVRVDRATVSPTEPDAVGQLLQKIRRFLGLLFRTDIVTPSSDENAMYAAASAARNSACLSRQVGAAVTSTTGEILGVGWNDVPQPGGGLYGKPSLFRIAVEGTLDAVPSEDRRCYAQTGGHCHNDIEKRTIAEKIVERLVSNGFVQRAQQEAAISTVMADTRVKDLIEFSRAVHAEMHAIMGASRVAGDRLLGGKIFVTTFPCHSCARHIVGAGLSEVIYIEPYRKSLATRLHDDAITEAVGATNKVRLLQFDGVAPRRFIELFEGGTRKRNGVLALPSRPSAEPVTKVSLRAIPRLEEVVVAEVRNRRLNLPALVTEDNRNEEDVKPTGEAA